VTISKLLIFLAGFFFGGGIDHVILAMAGRGDTPYGVNVGVLGNWMMAILDLALTTAAWVVHLRIEQRAHHRG
jgi:hypothetical protein